MKTPRVCGYCGQELPGHAPEGLCPRCLLDLGAAEWEREEVQSPKSQVQSTNGDVRSPSTLRSPPSAVPLRRTGAVTEDGKSEVRTSDSVEESQAAQDKEQKVGVSGQWSVASGRKTEARGQRFGNYELLEKIGQGGMGVVYKARQLNLDRLVAVKLLPFGQFSREEVVQRFRAEAAAAAGLQHPNIVAIHDVGEHEGQQFFSMDFVEGHTLAELVQDQPLSAKRAASYLRTIAEAVHYAHQHGILHRDLKPSNILIDATDQPRITDFGLAKRLSQTTDHGPRTTDLTLSGQVLGSPNFMSPEQAGGAHAIGPAADIYSLGALLYHLLTRQPPFQADTLTTLLKQVIESDPVPPRLLNPSIPRDLETICLKCLEKEVHRRYHSAQALAEDLGRFLSAKPVLARPIGTAGKTWRWCRRQPVRAGLVAAVILLLVAGTTGVLWQWREAHQSARAEARQRQTAEKAAYAANIGLIGALINDNRFDRARQLLLATPEPYRGWEWGWLQRQCNQDLMTLRPKAGVLQMFGVFSPDMRWLATGGFEPDIHLWELASGREVRRLTGHTGILAYSAFSPDGRQFASAGWSDCTARIWQVETGQLLWTLPHSNSVMCVAYSPDGTRLVTACYDRKARVWDTATGKLTGLSADYGDRVAFVKFSPDGRLIAFSGGFFYWADALDTSIRVWDLESGQIRRLDAVHQGTVKVLWSPKGDLLASAGWDGVVRLWEWPSGRELRQLEQTGRPVVLQLDFSPDGQFLAVAGANFKGSADPMGQIFEVRSGRLVRELAGHAETLIGIHFSPDSQLIATASGDSTVKVWPVQATAPALDLEGHDQPVWTVAFSPDQRYLATGSFDGTAKIWNPATGALLQDLPAGVPVLSLAFSARGDRLATACAENGACVWQAAKGARLLTLRGHSQAIMALDWSRDDRWIATGGKDNTVRIWDSVTGTEALKLTGHTGWVMAVAFAPDSKLLATGSIDQTIRLWNTQSGSCWRTLTNPFGGIYSLAFSPQRNLLASGGPGAAYLWDLRTGAKVGPPLLHRSFHSVTAVSFSPDGLRLATAANSLELYANNGRELQVHLWDVSSGHQLYSFAAHTNAVYAVAFGADGRTLATGGGDNTARIWKAFPWRLDDYQTSTDDSSAPNESQFTSLPDRIEQYKRQLWRGATNYQTASLTQRTSTRRTFHHPLGDLHLPSPGSKTKPLLPVPPRPAQAGSNQVDLTDFYNVALNESWQPVRFMHNVDFNLAAIPPGLRNFAGIDFDVRGLVQLRAASPDFELFPKSVMIPLQRCFQRLHVLHGTRWDVERGTPIALLVVHYAVGLQTNLPVCYGQHVAKSFPEDSIENANASEADWKEDIRPAPSEWKVHLYETTFQNPHPELEVGSIEYVSKLVRCGPFLVGLTLEEGAAPNTVPSAGFAHPEAGGAFARSRGEDCGRAVRPKRPRL